MTSRPGDSYVVPKGNAAMHNTEDKAWWCLHGAALEHRFVDMCANHLGIDGKINPEKATDPYAPDLVVNGTLADLKVQNTPFFTATRYDLDPRKTVTFNRKDYERYLARYPDIDIYFWVDWQQLSWRDSSVEHLAGVYKLPFQSIVQLIRRGAPEHGYLKRKFDRAGNAKSSFLLSLDDFECIFEV